MCLTLIFKTVANWKPDTLLKNRLQHNYFPDSFTEYLWTEDPRRPPLGNCFWILAAILRKSKKSWQWQGQWLLRFFNADLCGIVMCLLWPLNISYQQNQILQAGDNLLMGAVSALIIRSLVIGTNEDTAHTQLSIPHTKKHKLCFCKHFILFPDAI